MERLYLSFLNMSMNYVTFVGIFDGNRLNFALFQPVELQGSCRTLSYTVGKIDECVWCGNCKRMIWSPGVCMAESESALDTNKVGGPHRDGSRDYGIFQVRIKF